jgi:hypothetical protein
MNFARTGDRTINGFEWQRDTDEQGVINVSKDNMNRHSGAYSIQIFYRFCGTTAQVIGFLILERAYKFHSLAIPIHGLPKRVKWVILSNSEIH